MKIGNCPNCKRENTRITRGVCHNCYRKNLWNRKLVICKRCHRNKPHQSQGLCAGCYNFVFHLDKVKEWNQKKYHGIDYETYKKITEKCAVCSFDKVVDLHHLDENHKNNISTNLIGLCPNHHKMFHDFRYRKEIREDLIKKGFNVPKDLKLDFSLY
jgi:hypothetical protein